MAPSGVAGKARKGKVLEGYGTADGARLDGTRYDMAGVTQYDRASSVSVEVSQARCDSARSVSDRQIWSGAP